MARQNVPLLSYNRGLIDPEALARVDLDRTRLSAEVFNNWLPKTQGALRIRPGTKYVGSSLNDSGAEFIEFVAATDDVALPELTNEKMRVLLGSDAHSLSLLGRPSVATTLTITDTGWVDASTGGAVSTPSTDIIPTMTTYITNNVEIRASSEQAGADNREAWRAGDNAGGEWHDTGKGNALPSWLNIDLDEPGTDTGNYQAVTSYTIKSPDPSLIDLVPKAWRLLTGNYDTGTFATDTGKWTLVDERTSETGWAGNETRTYNRPDADTGTIEAQRHWRFYFTKVDNAGSDTGRLSVQEIELFTGASAQQVKLTGGAYYFNATAIGSLARLRKQVVVDTGDLNVEHALNIHVSRGPLTLRVGASQGTDEYVSETSLGTGYHNLAFTPTGNFHVTLQSAALVDRILKTFSMSDTGTVEITAPWTTGNLDNIRYDQSADVVYVDCDGVKPHKIERRGTGRSWSVVEYNPDFGPFRPFASSTAKLSVSQTYGNTTLNSDIPFFQSGHAGALMRLFHNGQSSIYNLGALDAVTDPIEVTGITDTGTAGPNRERRIVVDVTGTYTGTITLQKSFDGSDIGFHDTDFTDTGDHNHTFDDPDDNVTVWYRAKMSAYTSGVAAVNITYKGGGTTGIARVTAVNSNTDADIEVLRRFSDTGPTESWQEGSWSGVRGYPGAVALHGGRLGHAGGANLYLSVSDDYENFDDETIGDAAPLIKTLGSGPVDNIYYLASLLRLIAGTTGSEIALRSSSLDEPVTPSNANVRSFSTQGSANLRAIKMDNRAVFVQRSKQRVFMVGFGDSADSISDYVSSELTTLVPNLLKAGVVSIAIQRQPDTRIHCVLGDGTVAILTYEPQEEVLAWSKWVGDTGTGASVERAMVLPGATEDAVYYHINRTVNGSTKRYLEKWALESECDGDTGLHWIADCAASYTDTGRVTAADGWGHLVGASVVAWGDDTGQTDAGRDLSPDVAGVQTEYTVDTGGGIDISGTYSPGVHHLVAGVPFVPLWKSTKLAYAAEAGTALAQPKRVARIGFVLKQAHNNSLFFGNDTGNLDALHRTMDDGAVVDADKIYSHLDRPSMAFPGLWDTDSRIVLKGRPPRPVMVLAAVPTMHTEDKT